MIASLVSVSLLALTAGQSGLDESQRDHPYMIAEFDLYDLNADQRLTASEFVRAHGPVQPLRGAAARPPGAEGAITGVVFGAFLREGYRGETNLLFRHAEEISDECWRALESEVSAALASEFHAFDLDGDRIVEPREYGEAKLRMVRTSFEREDVNGDGLLTVEDTRAMRERIDAFRAERRAERPARMAQDSFRENAAGFVQVCAPQIDALDAERGPVENPVRTLNEDDPRRTPEGFFEVSNGRFDADGDGEVTFAEFARGFEASVSSSF